MTTADILESIRQRALNDRSFRKSLQETRSAGEPIAVFCQICRENGYIVNFLDN